MNNAIDDLLYMSGITAQGCWDTMDEYDKQAILNFARLLIIDVIDTAEHIEGISIIETKYGIKYK